MSLLASLKLPPVSPAGKPSRATTTAPAATPPPPAAAEGQAGLSQASSRKGGKVKTIGFEDGDTIVAGEPIVRASLKNAIALGEWSMSIGAMKREADDALRWLAKTDENGPFGDFDKAIEATRKDLGRGA